jgi:hypothetical protein
MLQEFYFRDDTDPNYIPDTFRVSDELEALVYQIRMTMGTTQGEVLGEPGFGVNPEDLLFHVNYDVQALTDVIYYQLEKYSSLAKSYNITIDPVKYNDGYREVGIYDIKVNGKSLIGYSYDVDE